MPSYNSNSFQFIVSAYLCGHECGCRRTTCRSYPSIPWVLRIALSSLDFPSASVAGPMAGLSIAVNSAAIQRFCGLFSCPFIWRPVVCNFLLLWETSAKTLKRTRSGWGGLSNRGGLPLYLRPPLIMASYWWLSILRPMSHIIIMVESLLFSFLPLVKYGTASLVPRSWSGSSSSFYSWLCAFTWTHLKFVYLCVVKQWSLYIYFPHLVININFPVPNSPPSIPWCPAMLTYLLTKFLLSLLACFCNLGTWETESGRLLQVGGQPGIRSAHCVGPVLKITNKTNKKLPFPYHLFIFYYLSPWLL